MYVCMCICVTHIPPIELYTTCIILYILEQLYIYIQWSIVYIQVD